MAEIIFHCIYLAITMKEILAIWDNVDEPGEYYAKRNKSDNEKQILHDFTNMWNQNKTKQPELKKIKIKIKTKNRLVIVRERKWWKREDIGQRISISSYKITCMTLIYSLVTIVNNNNNKKQIHKDHFLAVGRIDVEWKKAEVL